MAGDESLLNVISAATHRTQPALTEEEKPAFEAGAWLVGFKTTDDVTIQGSIHAFLWGVTADGRLILADANHKNITVGDIQRAAAMGLIVGDVTQPIIFPPPGRGGGLDAILQFDWWSFLEQGDLLIGLASGPAFAAFKTLRRRRIKNIAAQWTQHNLECPSQLRAFVHAKSEWQSRDVANLLGVTAEEAISLLHGVGYMKDPSSSIYRRDNSEGSNQNLARWMALEQEAEESWMRKRMRLARPDPPTSPS